MTATTPVVAAPAMAAAMPPAPPASAGPPPYAASSPPAPAKSGGSGCLKAFLIVAVACAVIGIGLFAVLVFAIDRGASTLDKAAKKLAAGPDAEAKVEQQTGIVTNPFGFDTKHPPQLDVYKRPLSCRVDSSSGDAVASGSVKNNSGHASSYVIAVEFRRDGTQVGAGVADVYRVDPGQVMDWKAEGPLGESDTSGTSDTSATTPTGTLTCAVTGILRSDNPNILPSTTTTTD